jgi:hypothetical protein
MAAKDQQSKEASDAWERLEPLPASPFVYDKEAKDDHVTCSGVPRTSKSFMEPIGAT